MATGKGLLLGPAIFVLGAGCNALFGLGPPTLVLDGGGMPGAGGSAGPDGGGSDGPGGWSSIGCSGSEGPAPVNIDGRFCIDSTMVTYAEYARFLAAASPSTFPQLGDCVSNNDFAPATGVPHPGLADDYPVTSVDLCDARAYCTWAGKRLCGPLPGVGNGLNTPGDSEGYYACAGGQRNMPYAYGPIYAPSACNTPDGAPTMVASMPDCVSVAYPGLYDLSGNIGFWEDMCDLNYCRDTVPPRGATADAYLCNVDNYDPRGTASADLGIRCCSDVVPPP